MTNQPFNNSDSSNPHQRLRVLLIAPYYDQNVAGESWSTYKWVQGISERHDVTVLTTHKKSWDPSASPTEAKEIVNWTFRALPTALGRLERELKPSYAFFYFRARKWIRRALKRGETFDLVHQINPLALRYPCPARGLGLKYIMGPLAGSLQTPPGFRSEDSDKQWYRKLRNLDSLRIKHDPWLRKSYAEAELILGVAPYVKEILQPAGIRRFEVASETGVETIGGSPKQTPSSDEPLRLLYVGRIIRTKGVIDAVRAVALAAKSCRIRFDVVGDGDMRQACQDEAQKLGVHAIVHFHGRVPRSEVDGWYKQAHVFLFPSFREPSGNVVFEAMSHGLPVIASAAGGPGYVVTEDCGFTITPTTLEEYPVAICGAIHTLSTEREKITTYSEQATKRISALALWSRKIQAIDRLYQDLLKEEPIQKEKIRVMSH